MRIIHTADWHLGVTLGREDRAGDLRRALERIARYCADEQADVLLVAGDLFAEVRRLDRLSHAIHQAREVFAPFVAGGGTIVALTGNHENEHFAYILREMLLLAAPAPAKPGGLAQAGRLYLANGPTFFRLADRARHEAQFVLMPYPTAAHYLDDAAQQYRSAGERNRNLRLAYGQKLRAILEHPNFNPALPTVLAAHLHVEGAVLSHPHALTEEEGVLLPAAELPTDFAYVALGHVHRPQCLKGLAHVRYSGSIDRMNLGEQNEAKSVVRVDIGPDGRRGEPVCLPLDPTPIYKVVVNPGDDLSRLRDRPDADRALVACEVTYTAGEDDLDGILRALREIFPRCYECSWYETGALAPPVAGQEPAAPSKGFDATVMEYLEAELAESEDRDDVLELARALLAEEPQ